MELWQLKQNHAEAIHSLTPEDGIVFDKNFPFGIRKWEGPKIQAALKLKGHSAFDFEKCACRKMKVE